ncbi:fatty acid desaturase family protein [Dyella japonica]|uniref:Fatty acid desaturase n=1 Tax=Dyella japonica TaxID=231455 RepID=A0ABV2K007_9GAMM
MPIVKPVIPEYLYRPSAWETLLYVVYGLALSLIPCNAIGLLFETSSPMAFKIVLSLPCMVVAGYGGFMLAVAGHEGFHFTLHANRRVSGALGVMISSLVPGAFAVGFFASHWEHHRYTNQPSDPDCKTFSRFRTFFQRLFLARLAANRNYLRYTLAMAAGRDLGFKYKPPFSRSEMQAFALFNVGCQVLVVTCFSLLAWVHPYVFLQYVAVPMVGIIFIGGLSPYQMHAGTGMGLGYDSRTNSSVFWTLLQAGSNYHNEHHLYPRVPCWRLPQVHQILLREDFYKGGDMCLEPRFWAVFMQASSAYQLAITVESDSDIDEFNEA